LAILSLFFLLLFLIKKDFFQKRVYYLLLIIILGIPANKFLYDYFKMYIFGINIIYILVSILLLSSIFSIKKIISKFNILDGLFSILFVLFLISLFIGIYNQNPYLGEDIKTYLFFFAVYFISRTINFSKEDIKNIMLAISIGGVIYSIISIYIYFNMTDFLWFIYGDMLTNWWGKRVAFSNVTILPLVVFIAFDDFLKSNFIKNYNGRKLLNIFVICLALYSMLISQTRSILFVTFLGLFIILMFNIFRYYFKTKRFLSKKVYIDLFYTSLVLSAIFLIFIYKLADSEIYRNFLKRLFYGPNTLSVRNVSNFEAFKMFLDNPLGYGLGKEMNLYSENGRVINTYAFIDNLYSNILVKNGIFGFLILVAILVYISILSITVYKNIKEEFLFMLAIMFPLFLILTTYMTTQLLYSQVVCFVFLSLYIISISLLYNKKYTNVSGEQH